MPQYTLVGYYAEHHESAERNADGSAQKHYWVATKWYMSQSREGFGGWFDPNVLHSSREECEAYMRDVLQVSPIIPDPYGS